MTVNEKSPLVKTNGLEINIDCMIKQTACAAKLFVCNIVSTITTK